MTSYKASAHFQWRDRYGLLWSGRMEDNSPFLDWYVRPENIGGRYEIHIETRSIDSGQQMSRAYLMDVRIDQRMENRGAGSMLLRRALKECKRRGYKGIEGDLSRSDSGHFDKLRHFYEKLGCTVIFYEANHPDYRNPWDGKITMVFAEE